MGLTLARYDVDVGEEHVVGLAGFSRHVPHVGLRIRIGGSPTLELVVLQAGKKTLL